MPDARLAKPLAQTVHTNDGRPVDDALIGVVPLSKINSMELRGIITMAQDSTEHSRSNAECFASTTGTRRVA
jgi:hypothetical protein